MLICVRNRNSLLPLASISFSEVRELPSPLTVTKGLMISNVALSKPSTVCSS